MSDPAIRVLAALVSSRDEPTDAELLDKFTANRDSTAFELLVWRHAGLVLRVCRGVLRDHHAAEDAAQAVFLTLARRAASVGRAGSAAGWLFRVSRRVAVRASRRPVVTSVPTSDLDMLTAPEPARVTDSSADGVLHEELARLPDRYRLPVLLCFFEGLTQAEAARRLNWPVGTVAGRMARAKSTLAARLVRRGVPLSLLTPLVVAVVPSFAAATTRAAISFTTRTCSAVPAPVLALANGEIRMATARKILGTAISLAAVCSFLVFGLRSSAEPRAFVPAPPPAGTVAPQKPPAVVFGKSFAIAPITTELQRKLIHAASPDSTALLIMDGPAIFKGATTLDVEALDPAGLRNALKAFRPVKGKSVVHFEVHYTNPKDPSGPVKEVLDFALQGAARAEGFLPGTPHGLHSYPGSGVFDFDRHVAPLKDDKGTAEAEAGLGDGRARAYPVRTPLSRMLTQSVAGVVFVLPPLDCRSDNWVPEEVDKSVRAALGRLKLVKGGQVNVHLNIPERDERTQERVRAACKQWAADTGLVLWAFAY